MRYCILKAGRATRATRERIGDFDAMFLSLLSEPDQHWDVFDVEHGRFPPSLGDYAGVVLTGGPASATDDVPWVKELLNTVRACRDGAIPLLGICFGLQVVAQALGGQVAPNPEGWEIGLVELEPIAAGAPPSPLTGANTAPLTGKAAPLRILEVHQDIASRLPPGAVPLARSARTPFEAFTLGERILCLQGHPEMDNDAVLELIGEREQRGLLPPLRAAEGRKSLENSPHRPFFRNWLKRFLREGRIPRSLF